MGDFYVDSIGARSVLVSCLFKIIFESISFNVIYRCTFFVNFDKTLTSSKEDQPLTWLLFLYSVFQFLLYCTAKLKSGCTCLQMYLRTLLGLYFVLYQTSAAAASQQHLLLLVFDCILFDRGVIELHERVASATQRISAAIGNEKSHPLTSKIDPKKSEQIVRSKPTNQHHF